MADDFSLLECGCSLNVGDYLDSLSSGAFITVHLCELHSEVEFKRKFHMIVTGLIRGDLEQRGKGDSSDSSLEG